MDDPIYKNAEQIEFCQLLERAKAAGFKPADVARILHLSKASLSKIPRGKQTPRPATLQSFRRFISELGQNTYEDMTVREESTRYAEKLSKLPDAKRELAKSLIDQLLVDDVAKAAGETAVEEAKKPSVVYGKHKIVTKKSASEEIARAVEEEAAKRHRPHGAK